MSTRTLVAAVSTAVLGLVATSPHHRATLGVPVEAAAQEAATSTLDDQVDPSVYNSDIALIRIRNLRWAPAPAICTDIAATVNPASALQIAPPSRVSVLEQCSGASSNPTSCPEVNRPRRHAGTPAHRERHNGR
jgi:hypothetical protein